MQLKCGGGAVIEMMELRVVSELQAQVAKFLSSGSPSPDGTGDMMDDEVTITPAMAAAASPRGGMPGMDPVTVRPVEFASFDQQPNIFGEENKNLQLVMDVTLNLTVELGKTELSIKEVLELTRGSVIELDRVAGEPVDLMANGKLIAKGEVVVIEDNFGLRITSIISPADRLRGL
jgi:flagellar motor switch protein FliN/FliY